MMILQKTALPEELLTVVIPVYNREKIVMRTLKSLEQQKVHPSIILVDNNSTDGTYAVLEQWIKDNPKIPATLLKEERKGATHARNCGLEQVKTPWVMFFDSDDRMLEYHLSNIVNAIRINSSNRGNSNRVQIIGWDVAMEFEEGSRKTGVFYKDDPVFYSLFGGSMATARWAAKTDLVRKAGGWNPNVELWDDIDLGLRMLRFQPGLYKISGKPNVEVFVTSDSITAMRYYDENKRLEHTVASLKKTLEDTPQAKYIQLLKAIYAAHYYKEGHKDEAKRLFKEALTEAQADQTKMRPMLSFAYHYTRLGGRGIARILRRFITV